MKTLISVAVLMTATLLSAQQLAETPRPEVPTAVKAANAQPVELLSLLSVPESARVVADHATADHATGEPAVPATATVTAVAPPSTAPPEAPPFRSTKQVSEAPFPEFHKKIFVSEFAAYTVANVVDGITTVRGVRRGFTEASYPKGAAELLGRRPGIARYTLTMGAMQGVATFASYRMQHSRNRMVRMLGHSLMMEGIADHTSGFVNNMLLGSHP